MSLVLPVSSRDHSQGNSSATIELVEYGDYQSILSGQAYLVIKSLQRKFRDELVFVFRNFPLTKIHSHAMSAAIASEAADRQGKFWPMHDMLFENQEELHLSALNFYAGQIGINVFQFGIDMEDEMLKRKIEEDFDSGVRSGVVGTPAFFINGQRYNGSCDEHSLSLFIKIEIQELSRK